MRIYWIEALIVSAIILMLIAVGVGVYNERQSPTIEIKKSEWSCIKSEQRTHLQPMGKSLMPMTETVCLEYKRHAG